MRQMHAGRRAIGCRAVGILQDVFGERLGSQQGVHQLRMRVSRSPVGMLVRVGVCGTVRDHGFTDEMEHRMTQP